MLDDPGATARVPSRSGRLQLSLEIARADRTGWSHVALVRSLAASGSGALRAYLDGVLVAIPHMSPSREGLCSSAGPRYVGAVDFSGCATTPRPRISLPQQISAC